MTGQEIERVFREMGATYVSAVLTATCVAVRVHVLAADGTLVAIAGEGVTLDDAIEAARRKVAARAG